MTVTKEQLRERLKSKGWILQEYDVSTGDMQAICEKGHKVVINKTKLYRATACLYCRGIKATPEQVAEEALQQGYVLKAHTRSCDPYGNYFVKKASMILLECLRGGHAQPMLLRDLPKGKQCATCYRENGYISVGAGKIQYKVQRYFEEEIDEEEKPIFFDSLDDALYFIGVENQLFANDPDMANMKYYYEGEVVDGEIRQKGTTTRRIQ